MATLVMVDITGFTTLVCFVFCLQADEGRGAARHVVGSKAPDDKVQRAGKGHENHWVLTLVAMHYL